MSEGTEVKQAIAGIFDRAAATYDQTGVDFFGRVGRRLVELVELQPGERVLDLGSGLGASALPAAERVGPSGRVLALDLAPRMVEGLAQRAAAAGLGHLEVRVGDAESPVAEPASWDAVLSGLCLFFLPDCGAAVRRYRDLLRPGGRLGVSWFGADDARWDPIYTSLVAELPAEQHGPKRPGSDGPFNSPAAMDAFLTEAGYVEVRTQLVDLTVVYADEQQWWDTLWSHGRRITLEKLRDAGVLESTRRRMGPELDPVRRRDGSLEWTASMAYTIART
ncbi:MAG TPA: methyltransferase domain-containing protein [Nocardioidaceae bacterium]|nr:methyltransferase domain-containing protein [Nocardioidaceae bacterium]